MIRPIRVPYRGPLSSRELCEFSQQVDQVLHQLAAMTLPEPPSSDPPAVDWEIERLHARVHTELLGEKG